MFRGRRIGGNLSALIVARDTAPHRRHGAAPDRPLVALSPDAHRRRKGPPAARGRQLTVVTHDHRLIGPALRTALGEDPRRCDVIGVVATAGTTNAGIVDDLAGVADLSPGHALWFHIDGAYGGAAALFSTAARPQFAGFERADSFIVDPHKWLFAPFDCAALVYRQPDLAKAVHTQHAQYLEVVHTENPEEWNPSDYAFHLTGRAPGCRSGSPWPSTAPTPTARPSRWAWPWPSGQPSGCPSRPTSSWCAIPGSPSFSSGGRDGTRPTTRSGQPNCSTCRSASSHRRPGKARRSPASPSCTPNTTIEMVDEILSSMVDP